MNIKRFLIWLFILLFVLIVVLGIVAWRVFFYSPHVDIPLTQIDIASINRTEIGIEQVMLILYSLNAQDLHNPLLSKDTPKIDIYVDAEVFGAEIINNQFLIKRQSMNAPDMKVIMSRQEFINSMNSDTKEYLKNSVTNGNTQIELVAGKIKLGSKGYLSLYKEITGKTLPI